MRWREILKGIAARRPKRVISGDEGEPYLERYYLCHLGPAKRPWAVLYLHHFVGSDPERGVHDHPWPWAMSVILAGGYWEEWVTPDGRGRHRDPLNPGTLRWFGGHYQHRVILPDAVREDGGCWTLFAHGPWTKPWGFFRYSLERSFCGLIQRREYREYSAKSSAGWWRKSPGEVA